MPIEAKANGIPVLASDRGVLPETLDDAGFVLTIPKRCTRASRAAMQFRRTICADQVKLEHRAYDPGSNRQSTTLPRLRRPLCLADMPSQQLPEPVLYPLLLSSELENTSATPSRGFPVSAATQRLFSRVLARR